MLETVVQLIESIVGNLSAPVMAESTLKEDIGMNSYEVVQLIGNLEEAYDVTIPVRKIKSFKTVQNILDYLQDCQV